MISVKQNKIALLNLRATFDAIENIDKAIAKYSDGSTGPAYIAFEYANLENLQIDRELMVTALVGQREKLVSYLRSLGIEWDVE